MTPMRKLVLALLATGALAGCGAKPEPHSTATATPTPAAQAKTLLYAWRNFEETGIPEEATIHTDGTVQYRNLLHTQKSIRTFTRRLPPAELRAIRSLVGQVDLAKADASGKKPRRDGYRWVLRRNGVVGTAADGHVHGTLGTLVRRLSLLMDRLRSKSL
jgi:hypothetical protein